MEHIPPPFLQEAPPPPLYKQVTQETYNYAASLLITQKRNAEDVKAMLIQQGYDAASADTVVTELQKADHINKRKRAQADIKVGSGVCVLGIAITVITYSIASSGGGTYFVAWGAIAFGFLQFLKGLFNLAKYK